MKLDASMVKISYKTKKDLPDSAFALPESRKYPLIDSAHCRDALARASEGLKKGWITQEEHDTIVRKAKAVLGEK